LPSAPGSPTVEPYLTQNNSWQQLGLEKNERKNNNFGKLLKILDTKYTNLNHFAFQSPCCTLLTLSGLKKRSSTRWKAISLSNDRRSMKRTENGALPPFPGIPARLSRRRPRDSCQPPRRQFFADGDSRRFPPLARHASPRPWRRLFFPARPREMGCRRDWATADGLARPHLHGTLHWYAIGLGSMLYFLKF
jgi:hypothetical protein